MTIGQRFDRAPGLTLTEGIAAVHQALVGDRLALALDAELAWRVTGRSERLAHPALVWDVAIGQSTVATQRVIANLFYRGLVLQRAPALGDTLRTRTEVVALRPNRPRPGRPRTGLAGLRVTTVDQRGGTVLDFYRCAMLPSRGADVAAGDLDAIGSLRRDVFGAAVEGWTLADAAPERRSSALAEGEEVAVEGGDVVSGAPELARLTLNLATVHSDAAAGGGRRLVYGGHTVGIAAAHVSRALPDVVWFVGWRGCDHLAPVYEGETLYTRLRLERRVPLESSGALLDLRCVVRTRRADGSEADVLDWRPVAVTA